MNSLKPELLRKAIDDSGITMTNMAKKIGISRESLYNKLEKKSEFSVSEINSIQQILHLTNSARDVIFFGK